MIVTTKKAAEILGISGARFGCFWLRVQ